MKRFKKIKDYLILIKKRQPIIINRVLHKLKFDWIEIFLFLFRNHYFEIRTLSILEALNDLEELKITGYHLLNIWIYINKNYL
jgi:hypothetical protein